MLHAADIDYFSLIAAIDAFAMPDISLLLMPPLFRRHADYSSIFDFLITPPLSLSPLLFSSHAAHAHD